ncbi:Protein of unknown function (DUF2945) [Larkinella arboricola]|uniref:Hypervirulence associated protein TUDOR domain-containing protein n=1 Tax=Larkinella arboricola TaxID=643671 RepID=A0A327X1V0_LARAB|nr:DUF2945 domain-containing protein [Larkinella arboricola]RAK00100.1 Protein of unknown function (DUF2945) [Larkinella arboricola]
MIKKGDSVRWKYASGHAEGKVVEIHKEAVEKTIKGSKVKRNGSADDPALIIEQDDNDLVLKLESEVEKVHP